MRLISLFALLLAGQEPASLRFEVASVKPAGPERDGPSVYKTGPERIIFERQPPAIQMANHVSRSPRIHIHANRARIFRRPATNIQNLRQSPLQFHKTIPLNRCLRRCV